MDFIQGMCSTSLPSIPSPSHKLHLVGEAECATLGRADVDVALAWRPRLLQ